MSIKCSDVDFVNTDAESVLTEMINKFEEITKRTLYPASPERLFIAWMASIVVQQRVLINETAKMNVLRFAANSKDEAYLDNLAELFWDIRRMPACPASAIFRFYISEPQGQSVIIPAGTRITFDGEIMFATIETIEIKAGETTGEVIAECTQPGVIGNGMVEGKVKNVVDIFDYYEKAENITVTGGGAEREDNASYYERIRESIESFSTTGTINGYKYAAKSVSSAVADVAVESPDPGVVDVRILMKDGQQATQSTLEEITKALNADDVRPLTDRVIVSVPDMVAFTVDVTYFILKDDIEAAKVVETKVNSAVEDYIKWQTGKMGRDINPSYLMQLMMEAGAKRIEIRQPEFKRVMDIEVGKLEAKIVINGGMEDG